MSPFVHPDEGIQTLARAQMSLCYREWRGYAMWSWENQPVYRRADRIIQRYMQIHPEVRWTGLLHDALAQAVLQKHGWTHYLTVSRVLLARNCDSRFSPKEYPRRLARPLVRDRYGRLTLRCGYEIQKRWDRFASRHLAREAVEAERLRAAAVARQAQLATKAQKRWREIWNTEQDLREIRRAINRATSAVRGRASENQRHTANAV